MEPSAAAWLRRQRQQPVERLDWLRGEQVKESAGRLADSGKTIADGVGQYAVLARHLAGRKKKTVTALQTAFGEA